MATSVFETLKETIEDAKARHMTDEAKLIMWGRITQSVGLDEISQPEARELEAMLGDLRGQYGEAFDVALFGSTSSKPVTAGM